LAIENFKIECNAIFKKKNIIELFLLYSSLNNSN
jgi:hypothetical protein